MNPLKHVIISSISFFLLGACTVSDPVSAENGDLPACSQPADLSQLPGLPTGLPEYTANESGPGNPFPHGIASGDPTDSDVILWTRVTTDASSPATVTVLYEVALDEAFTQRVAADEVTTDASRDYTVKVDVQDLAWGRNYFYRFQALGKTSPIGKTRLAPLPGEARCARFAVVSCSSYAHGYFYAYGHVANADVDAVLHLGDYIYEYGSGGYGAVRAYEPEHEIVTLEDYRTRYKQYRRDANLQAVHAAHPMYAIWDDHESANNSYADGADNHDEAKEGSWGDRKRVARQAYFEYLPIRDTNHQEVWRSFSYGDLADITFLDTRIAGRDEQLTDAADDTAERHILGEEQEKWLGERLANGSGRWQIIAQQVMVSQMLIQDNPFNLDQWDGYSNARERLFEMIDNHTQENTAILTGDIHSSWAYEVAPNPHTPEYLPEIDNLAVEFVVPGISSPGLPDGFMDLIGDLLYDENPHLRWADFERRGYMILDVDADRLQADWYHLDGVLDNQGHQYFAKGFIAPYGDARLTEAPRPVTRSSSLR